jgi:predicted permease
MLLVGFTVAGYHLPRMLTKKRVYIATALRLVLLPAVIVVALFGIKSLTAAVLHMTIDNTVLFLCFFAVATPLGLNTVVIPAAYGRNTSQAAGMALVSHMLSCFTIPLMFLLLQFVI